MYEILINVYKHSKFKSAYCKVLAGNDDEDIDIRIFDNGIGISKSFEDASMPSKDDCEAIFEAINGKTSAREKYCLRGRGLNSTARLITLGFGGEMLIVSGRGICRVTKEGAKSHFKTQSIKGTFVILKIKSRKVRNIYEYLKFENIAKIKEV